MSTQSAVLCACTCVRCVGLNEPNSIQHRHVVHDTYAGKGRPRIRLTLVAATTTTDSIVYAAESFKQREVNSHRIISTSSREPVGDAARPDVVS